MVEIREIYKAIVICHKMGVCDGNKAREELKYLTDKVEEFERKAKAYDNVMTIVNHKDYLFTFVVADLTNNSEVTLFNEKGVEMFVDVRGLRESEGE